MPPQAGLIAAGIAWNYSRSRAGKTTISQFARRHKVAAVAVWVGATLWVIPHWLHD